MVEEPNAQKRDDFIKARPRSDVIKTWAVVILGGLSAYLLWFLFKRGNFIIEVNGQQFIFGCILVAAAIWWLFKDKTVAELPEVDKMAMDCMDWAYRNGLGLLDITRVEITQLSDQRASVYFVNNEVTLTYQAGKGIMEQRYRDIDTSLRAREETDLLRGLNATRTKDESIKAYLERRGFTVEGND